ncbi:MAG: DnaA/Hda family protein [Alphaproteobacteria bacterium]
MTAGGQIPLDLPHRRALDREDFLVADCNRVAVGWIDRWPEWPSPALVLYGPEGAGKTHLAAAWQGLSGAIWCDAATLDVADVGRLTGQGQTAFVADAADVSDADQRALLHLYNIVAERQGHLVLTCREPPARWHATLPDLRSRLAAAGTAALGAPDDALLAAVMVKQFADRQLQVGAELPAFILPRIERSFAAVGRIVAALDRAALAAHRPITIPLARDVLARIEAENMTVNGED